MSRLSAAWLVSLMIAVRVGAMHWRLVFPLVIASFFAMEIAHAAESRIQSAVMVSEEYNDNIFLLKENRIADYITHVAPALAYTYKAPVWDWEIKSSYDYRNYARRTIQNDNSLSASIANETRIVADTLYLKVNDQYKRVSLNNARDYTLESSKVNQSDQNIIFVNPYFVLRPTKQTTVTTGYTYMNTWYKDPSAIGRTDHIGSIEVQEDISPRLMLAAGGQRTQDKNDVQAYIEDDFYVTGRYEFAPASSVKFRGGKSWFQFSDQGKASQEFWDGNVTYRVSKMTFIIEAGLRFIPAPLYNLQREDWYMATIKKESERTAFSITGGLNKYRDPFYGTIDITKYSVAGNVSHAITAKSKIAFDINSARLLDRLTDSPTNTYVAGTWIEYQTGEQMTLAFDYHYSMVYVPTNDYANCYYNNRFIVELKKTF